MDRFRLVAPLGAGGHGTVWLAHDERLRRNVALKRIPRAYDANREDRHRIGREAVAAARLSHPAIVGFYEALSDDHAYYLVTELVQGTSLANLYADGSVDDRELLQIGVALTEALDHAHTRGVVHRDIKPQNVLVASDPAATGAPAKLADFGVARIADEQPLTHSGDVIGTFAYMAPEQAVGDTTTAATDLYALALTLYEGFAGANPLRGATAAATARRLGLAIAPLARLRPDLSPPLCAAIDRALSPEPASRGSVGELRSALLLALHSKSRHRRSRPHPRPASALTPRGERLVAGLGAAALSAIALATVLGPHYSRATDAAVAGIALVAVAAAPGAGWLVLGFGAIAWLALSGQSGTALVLFAALAPVPILLVSAPWLWSAAILAPVLGAFGVAAAYPGLAAGAGSVSAWRRAALGALGYWWVALSEELAGRRFLFGAAAGVRPRASWEASVPGALAHALAPLCSSQRLAPALLWACAALVLPWLVREASLALRAVAAIVWAATLIVASVALAHHLGASGPPLPVAAALLAGAIALALGSRRFGAPARAVLA
jgi:tRNA A-37 threonylcarbamoyl transferase component Bud32